MASAPSTPRPYLPRRIVRDLVDLHRASGRGDLAKLDPLSAQIQQRLTPDEWRLFWDWALYWSMDGPEAQWRYNQTVHALIEVVLSVPLPSLSASATSPACIVGGLRYTVAAAEADARGRWAVSSWLDRYRGAPAAGAPLRSGGAPVLSWWDTVPLETLTSLLPRIAALSSANISHRVIEYWPAAVIGLHTDAAWRTALQYALDVESGVRLDLKGDAALAPASPASPAFALREIPRYLELGALRALAARADWPLSVQQWFLAHPQGTLGRVGRGPAVPRAELLDLIGTPHSWSLRFWHEVARVATPPGAGRDGVVAAAAGHQISRLLTDEAAFATGALPEHARFATLASGSAEARALEGWLAEPAFVAALTRPAVARLLASSTAGALRERLVRTLGTLAQTGGLSAARSLHRPAAGPPPH